MHMKRTMTLLAAAVLTAHAAHAQYVTYNHDSPKQNQITIHPGNLLHAAAQQVQEDGGGEEQAVVPDAGRSESLQPDRRGGSHRLGTGQTGRCRGIERGRQAGGPGLACRGRQGERTDGTLPAQHRPHSPVWRHAGRTGTLGRILSGVPVRHQRHQGCLHAQRPAEERVPAHQRGCRPAERDACPLPRTETERHRDGGTAERRRSTAYRQRKHPARCRGAVERIPVCRAWLADGWRQRRKRRRRNREQELKKKRKWQTEISYRISA